MSQRRRKRLAVENLEERRLLAVMSVSDPIDSGDGSLRQAITQANLNEQDDIILLGAGSFKLTSDGIDDRNVTGDLDITESGNRLLIRGAGIDQTIITAEFIADRVLHIGEGAIVELEDLSIIGGSDVAMGGGILKARWRLLALAVLAREQLIKHQELKQLTKREDVGVRQTQVCC